jgi:hypothetical protein
MRGDAKMSRRRISLNVSGSSLVIELVTVSCGIKEITMEMGRVVSGGSDLFNKLSSSDVERQAEQKFLINDIIDIIR